MSLFDLNKFNDLINNVNKSISCGPSCVQQKTADQLKQKYIDAQTNKDTAEYQVFNAAKNYITYTQGEPGYTDYLEKQLTSKGDTIASTFNQNFINNSDIIKNNINTFKSLFINVSNVRDLYNKYKNENDKLEDDLINQSHDILTNDRKTYYEDQGINNLNTYYYFLIVIYFIIVTIFLLAIIFVNTTIKLSYRILILFVLIIYPFIIMFVFNLINDTINKIKDYIPSNAYRRI
jgi:hypothetical protein